MNTPEQYPTDLTQAQWEWIAPWLPKPKWRTGGPGRPPADLHQVINSILYLRKNRLSMAHVAQRFWALFERGQRNDHFAENIAAANFVN